MQDATFSYLLFVASRLLKKEKEKKREQHPRFTVSSFIDGVLLTVSQLGLNLFNLQVINSLSINEEWKILIRFGKNRQSDKICARNFVIVLRVLQNETKQTFSRFVSFPRFPPVAAEVYTRDYSNVSKTRFYVCIGYVVTIEDSCRLRVQTVLRCMYNCKQTASLLYTNCFERHKRKSLFVKCTNVWAIQ